MRVLVCGGRAFTDWQRLSEVMADQIWMRFITCVIEGGTTGADRLARQWALAVGVPFETYEADWKRFGNRAGPIRNQRMLDEGQPDLVIAFPGGRGTTDMVRRARTAGIEVVEVGSSTPEDGSTPQIPPTDSRSEG